MRDPLTQAFDIKSPISRPGFGAHRYRNSILTIWHRDPEKDGTDDSCGWFMRSRHGNPEVLAKIRSDFAFEWDASYGGWFDTGKGAPLMSSMAITLGMMYLAARAHFGSHEKARKFQRKHLLEILAFAENPTDSMHQSITNKYGFAPREDRINEAASIIYAWVLRASRPWYKHPRWHLHHWRIQFHPWQQLRRRYFDKCAKCGKRGFPKGVQAIGDWEGTRIWHDSCDGSRVSGVAAVEPRNEA